MRILVIVIAITLVMTGAAYARTATGEVQTSVVVNGNFELVVSPAGVSFGNLKAGESGSQQILVQSTQTDPTPYKVQVRGTELALTTDGSKKIDNSNIGVTLYPDEDGAEVAEGTNLFAQADNKTLPLADTDMYICKAGGEPKTLQNVVLLGLKVPSSLQGGGLLATGTYKNTVTFTLIET
jgi:hypothetical protein